MAWMIPAMTDPMGKHWGQPKGLRERVGLYDTHATIPERDWLSLPHYRSSIPSGVYPGKVWRCGPWLCWYGPERDGRCKVVTVRALVQ